LVFLLIAQCIWLYHPYSRERIQHHHILSLVFFNGLLISFFNFGTKTMKLFSFQSFHPFIFLSPKKH
jgi:hypothetical protein